MRPVNQARRDRGYQQVDFTNSAVPEDFKEVVEIVDRHLGNIAHEHQLRIEGIHRNK